MIDSSVPVENLNQRIHGMDDCERQAHHADSETPWQNQYVERLIDSIRRDCLDHTIVLAESHLRKIMTAYKAY